MTSWSLETLLADLHSSVTEQLARARRTMGHPVAKGDVAESVWAQLLAGYLPQRYKVAKAFVCDSEGQFSDQLDVVVYDRQYSPLIFEMDNQVIIPAESVYAVFEAKQEIDAAQVSYAAKKIASVRALKRTSLPVPHIGGSSPPKPLQPIIGGLLTFESGWSPPLGASLAKALAEADDNSRLDIGCIAAHGWFACDDAGCHVINDQGKPATAFLLELIARLQGVATVPMIDIRAYAKWLTD